MFFRRKAVLFIHGFVGGAYDFGVLPRELESLKQFDVYSFTLTGHDLTIVKNVKYEKWINDAREYMDFLVKSGYKEIYVIGHSMGGVIASYIASEYPQVKKLVLAAPAFGYFSFKNGAVDIKGFNATIKGLKDSFSEYNSEYVMSRIIKTPINKMIEFTKLVNCYYDSIKNVNCETLIIHGNDDYIVPSEATIYAYDNIGTDKCLLYNINDVNHNCFREKRSDEINDLIIKFFKNKTNKKNTLNI